MAEHSTTEVALDEEAVHGLDERTRGALLLPGQAGYDEARAVRNGLIDRRPALIARCTGAADVVAAVNFAREHDSCSRCRAVGTTSLATPSTTAAS